MKDHDEDIDIILSFPSLSSAEKLKDILPAMLFINENLYKQNYKIIDNILWKLKVYDISVLSMVSIIRMTFPAKSKLHNWNFCLDKIEAELMKRGEDYPLILRGLK